MPLIDQFILLIYEVLPYFTHPGPHTPTSGLLLLLALRSILLHRAHCRTMHRLSAKLGSFRIHLSPRLKCLLLANRVFSWWQRFTHSGGLSRHADQPLWELYLQWRLLMFDFIPDFANWRNRSSPLLDWNINMGDLSRRCYLEPKQPDKNCRRQQQPKLPTGFRPIRSSLQ